MRLTIRALLTALAIVLVVNVAHADSTDVIHACTNRSGELRVPPNGTCRLNEKPIEWNEQGPPGQAATAASFTVLSDTIPSIPGETVHTVTCPDGMSALAATGWITVTPLLDEYGEPEWSDEAGTYLLLTRVYDSRVELELRNWVDYYRPTTLTWHVTCGVG